MSARILVLLCVLSVAGPAWSEPPVQTSAEKVTSDNAAFIIVSTDFATNTVTIDGQPYARKHQRSKVGMPVLSGTLHLVQIENSDSKAKKTYRIKLKKGEARVILVELSGYDLKGGPSPPSRNPAVNKANKRVAVKADDKGDEENIGFLTVNSVPTAQVYIDGKLVSSQTPLVKHKVAPGNHTVRVYYTDKKKFSETKRALITQGRHVNLYFQNRDK